MKALIVTDLHLRPSHMGKARAILELIEQKIDELKPDYLFNLGDTFHTKNTVPVIMQNLYEAFLERVTKKVKVINLIGNHDWAVPYTDHPMKTFRMENLTIVDDVFVMGENAFISYARETERFQEMIAKAGPGINRIFAHMDMNGITPGSGWEEIVPFFDPDFFSNYKQIISGHLHLAQEKVLSSGTEIIYVGSGYTTDFGESDQFKRFLFMDLDTGEWESIPTNMNFYKTLHMNAGEPFPVIPEEEIDLGIEYRVFYKGTKEEFASKIVPKEYIALGVRVLPDFVNSQGPRIELASTDTQDETIEKFALSEIERSYGGLEKSGFDLKRLKEVARKHLKKD